ncbi:MAG TPA: hemolysin family protein [Anaerolineales bacterium]|nr:hemolysin family protein [Anaerolineales bacterium]
MGSETGLDLIRLVIVALLILTNGFFVAAEFSLVSVRRTRIDELIQQGNRTALFVKKALDNPDEFIAATQLGITIASLALGWVGEPAISHFLEPLLELLPEEWVGVAGPSISAAIAFTLITFLHVIIGELMPKSIALQDPDNTALFIAQPTLITKTIFKPAIWAMNGAGNFLLRLIGVQPPSDHQLGHSVQELKMLVEASERIGIIENIEREMLHAVFDFGNSSAHEVMVPRTEMHAVDADAPVHELIHLAIQHPFSKFPVYEGDIDHIIGIAHTKDLVRVQHSERLTATIRGIVREALFVPDTIKLDALLHEFRTKRQHMAIVLDEYGGTAGLVTLDDLISQIMGPVSDTFDKSTPEIQRLPDGSALIEGMTPIDDVNQHFSLELKDENYDTIAGFILGRLGRMAKVGDTIETDGVKLKVEALDGLRIARVSLKHDGHGAEAARSGQKTEV